MFHTVILAGRLGRKPELRYTPDGAAVTNLNVATDRKWNDSNGNKHDETTWFRVTLWGKTAENAVKYLDKGDPVLCEGRLQPDDNGNPRMWQDQNGDMRTSFEVVANLVKYLPSPKKQQPDEDPGDLFMGSADAWANI